MEEREAEKEEEGDKERKKKKVGREKRGIEDKG